MFQIYHWINNNNNYDNVYGAITINIVVIVIINSNVSWFTDKNWTNVQSNLFGKEVTSVFITAPTLALVSIWFQANLIKMLLPH